jgi:hypothetical protein
MPMEIPSRAAAKNDNTNRRAMYFLYGLSKPSTNFFLSLLWSVKSACPPAEIYNSVEMIFYSEFQEFYQVSKGSERMVSVGRLIGRR